MEGFSPRGWVDEELGLLDEGVEWGWWSEWWVSRGEPGWEKTPNDSDRLVERWFIEEEEEEEEDCDNSNWLDFGTMIYS